MVDVRPYMPADEADLWELKQAFERGLGAGTGDESKAKQYADKLTADYRARWLDWVADCVAESPACVQVAESEDGLVGYVFVLPESLAFIWDAAVLNEIFVRDAHRGRGVADELLAAAREVVAGQSLPLDRLVLDVDGENERAAAFYERHGFEHWGELVARDC